MSARRKNSKALKLLRRRGLIIDGNFNIPMESAVKFPSIVGNNHYQKYVTVDEQKKFIHIDPILARRTAGI